jgi:hypothetical protein
VPSWGRSNSKVDIELVKEIELVLVWSCEALVLEERVPDPAWVHRFELNEL